MSTVRNWFEYCHDSCNTNNDTDKLKSWIDSAVNHSKKPEVTILISDYKSKPTLEEFLPGLPIKKHVTKQPRSFKDKGVTFHVQSVKDLKRHGTSATNYVAFQVDLSDLYILERSQVPENILLVPWYEIKKYSNFEQASIEFFSKKDFRPIEKTDFLYGYDGFKSDLVQAFSGFIVEINFKIDSKDLEQSQELLREVYLRHKNNLPPWEKIEGYLMYEYKKETDWKNSTDSENLPWIRKCFV